MYTHYKTAAHTSTIHTYPLIYMYAYIPLTHKCMHVHTLYAYIHKHIHIIKLQAYTINYTHVHVCIYLDTSL